MQQTSHKIFMGEKNRMVAAFEEERQQRAGQRGGPFIGFWSMPSELVELVKGKVGKSS